MFVPAPNVDSAIVRIDYNKEKFEIDNQKVLDNLIKNAFLMRRKTLANNLKNGFGFSRDQISKILLSASLDENVRGESLSVQKFVELSNIISKNLK